MFYFIDPSLIKNRNFYQPELVKLQESWGARLSVSYGQDMFDQLRYKNIKIDIIKNKKKKKKKIKKQKKKKKKKKKMYKIHKNKNCGENRVIRIKNIIIA